MANLLGDCRLVILSRARDIHFGMSTAEIIAELPKLPAADLREILNRILELHGDSSELTDQERALIEKRLADHAADPASAIPWEKVKARLVERYGE